MANTGPRLWVRPDIFEYGILPLPQHALLDADNLLRFLNHCKARGSKAFPKVSVPIGFCTIWTQYASSKMQLTEEQAYLYFETFDILETNDPRMRLARSGSGPQSTRFTSVDTLRFVLYLYAQQYSRISIRARYLSGEEWPSGQPDDADSGNASVRSANREAKLDESHQLQFVRRNILEMLTLLSDPSTEESSTLEEAAVASSAVASMSVLISAVDYDSNGDVPTSIDALARSPAHSAETGFDRSRGTHLVKSLAVWIHELLRLNPYAERGGVPHFSWPSSPDVDVPMRLQTLTRLSKRTIVRTGPDVAHGCFRISHSRQCAVYLLGPTEHVTVQNCRDCIVFVGAVARTLHISRCARVTVVATCKRVTIAGSDECTLFICSNTRPLLLDSTSRQLHIAPFNSYYAALGDHMEAAGVSPAVNLWDGALQLLGPTQPMQWSPLPPKDYAGFSVPFVTEGSTTANPCDIPDEYAAALAERCARVHELRAEVRKSCQSDPAHAKLFQQAMERRFCDWLNETGGARQLMDLSHMQQATAGGLPGSLSGAMFAASQSGMGSTASLASVGSVGSNSSAASGSSAWDGRPRST